MVWLDSFEESKMNHTARGVVTFSLIRKTQDDDGLVE